MLVTGDHGVRMQDNYTQDIAGPAGRPSAATPRWLRLTRSGDTITGYESAGGAHWTRIGTVTLAGLPATVQAGLFATSPAYTQTVTQGVIGNSGIGGPTLATGVFDHVSLRGTSTPGRGVATSSEVARLPRTPSGGGYHRSGGRFTVTGSGDIAPALDNGPGHRPEHPAQPWSARSSG